KNPKLKVPFLDSFPEEPFRRAAALGMTPDRVKGPFQVVPGIFSTGIVDGKPPEQSLVIETSQGAVMLVGCSHPGIVKLVENAKEQRKKDSIALLLGGFHLLRKKPEEINQIIGLLKQARVHTVLPAHCTGDDARDLFRLNYGKQFHEAGTGRQILLQDGKFTIRTLPKEK
ncbi:MAG: MBL fold metallo-hydrolase, partial [Planctomycetales bacterium]